jgi:bacteriorhodopsin
MTISFYRGLADGGNVIHPDSEMVFYGILDLLAKPVYSIYHLYTLSKVDYESFHLQSGKQSIYAHNSAIAQGAARKADNNRTSDVTAADNRV